MPEQKKIKNLTNDGSIIVGCSLIVGENLTGKVITPFRIGLSNATELDVPSYFFSGNVDAVREEMHRMVDDLLNAHLENEKTNDK